MKKVATLTINSHNIVFTKTDGYVRDLLESFCKKLIRYERKRRGRGQKPIIVKHSVYAASTADKKELRLHINHKEEVLKYLKNEGFDEEAFNIVKTPLYEAKSITFDIKDNRDPLPHQSPVIDFVCEPGKTKTITLPTGDGKTYVSLKAVAKIGKRLIIVILGRYINKWIMDVEEAFNIKKGDLIVVKGRKDLTNLINLALADELDAKIIICSSNTIQRYLLDYERNENFKYPVVPEKFFETLKVGVKLIDECHQFFHLNFKIDLYSNVPKSIFLSATLEPSDPFLDRMYRVMYPLDTRMQGKAKDKYIDVIACGYQALASHKILCKRDGNYSHVTFENQILRNSKLLNAYLEMIWEIVLSRFINVKRKDQKMIIFATTKKMCVEIKEYIIKKLEELKHVKPTEYYSDGTHEHFMDNSEDLSVEKFTAGDSYDNLLNSDIIVSTLGSSGTAMNIVNLKTCLMTVTMDSRQQNIQALGRLRPLVNYKDDNPEFIYIYCDDIDKHVAYHKNKYSIFKSQCRSHNSYFCHTILDYRNVRN